MQPASHSDGSTFSLRFDFGEDPGLGIAAIGVEAVELLGERTGALRISGGEHLDDLGGNVHASGGVDARGEAKGDIGGSQRAFGGIEFGKLE